MKPNTWSQVLLVAAAAVAVVMCADWLLVRIAPPVQMREAQDGMRDFERSNPDTLVLGSSHARTLHVLGKELEQRTHGEQTLVAVPLENGKLVPYRWILMHRLGPLIDKRDGAGKRAKSRLQRFVLISEWWDSCPRPNDSPYWNIPARAWTFSDFVRDVARHGITGYNRNYLQNRLRRTLSASALVYDRTQRALVGRLMDKIRGRPPGPAPEAVAAQLAAWRGNLEHGASCIGNDAQMQALVDIANFVQARGLEMSILLFPRKPATITPLARDTTLTRFAALVRSFAEPRGIRVVDLTTSAPVGDGDFMEDFDHVNAGGNLKFSAWALDHDLGFLLTAPAAASGVAKAQVR